MVTSFGGLSSESSKKISPSSLSEFKKITIPTPILAVGAGSSYGDVGLLSRGVELDTRFLDKILDFDDQTGILVCQPGVRLRDIQSTFVKRGWMLAVTPGTSNVTLGGAVANDVHGKDHHFAGTFGEHVLSLELIRTSGEVLNCSRSENAAMFSATIGGLGLTGIIAKVTLKLARVKGPFWETETIPYGTITDFFQISQESEDQGWQASVSWFDCSTSRSGRGSFVRGNRSTWESPSRANRVEPGRDKPFLGVPFSPPFSLVNKTTLNLFNRAYYNLQSLSRGHKRVHYRDFYYPLDGISNWNRIYGPKGFYQYQSVIPMENAETATLEMLQQIRHSRQGSFLGVLKVFGSREPSGLMSFPMRGVTLALDFPNLGVETLDLFDRLDAIVSESGGRLNPSKDARMSGSMIERGYPKLGEFLKFVDPGVASDFQERVLKVAGESK